MGFKYNPLTSTLDLVGSTSSGDVIGPATNTDGYIPQWNGADSKTLKNGIPTSTFATTSTKLDDFATPDNNTDLNANTTNHGLLLKATAPASGLYNYVGITNGETAYTNKALFDATSPSTQAFGDAAATGSATVAARRDHKHAMMAAPTSVSGNAGTVTVGNEASDTTCFPLFATGATGSLSPKTVAGYTFNANTKELTSTKFAGALNGTVGATTPTTGVFKNVTNASVGAELITTTADRDMSGANGWSGTNWSVAGGALMHTAGANNATLAGYTFNAGAYYQVTWTVTTTTVGTVSLSLGFREGVATIGRTLGTITETHSFTASDTSGVFITPNATWEGSVDDISVKLVTNSTPALSIKSGSNTSIEMRALASTDSFGIGLNALSSSATSSGNTAVGNATLRLNYSGTYNTAVGSVSLYSNVSSNHNTGVGAYSMYNHVSGDYNTAISSQSLYNNIIGAGNTAIGYKTLNDNYEGSGNIAIGYYAGKYETGSNAFYVDNQDRTNTAGDKAKAILYGVMDATASNQTLKTNSKLYSTYGVFPTANDGAPLGDATHQFSDLFLAEGGVINWDNGDATLTQASDVITLAGADLKVTTAGNASTSVITTDATQTMTNKTITQEAWVEIGSGGSAPAFENSWVNFSAGYSTAAYMKDSMGFVHLKGMVKNGTSTATMFTLPAGYRPAAISYYGTTAGDAFGEILVNSNGVVSKPAGSTVFCSLDGITFRAA